MTIKSSLEKRELKKTLSLHRIDIQESYKSWVDQIDQIEKPNNVLKVDIEPVEGIYYFSLNSDLLSNSPNVIYVNQGKPVAFLSLVNGHCQLFITDQVVAVEVVAHFEGESLSIKSPSKLLLSGNIHTKQQIDIDCHQLSLLDTQVFLGTEICRGDTHIAAASMIVHSAEDIHITDKVMLDIKDQLYLSGAKVKNQGLISTKQFITVADQVDNEGTIEATIDFTGFALAFLNKGKLKISHLFSFSTDEYSNTGSHDCEIFNLQAQNAHIGGFLAIHQETIIIAGTSLKITTDAVLQHQGQFVAECGGSIEWAGKMKHSHSQKEKDTQFRLISEDNLTVTGYLSTESTRAHVVAKKELNITGMFSSNDISTLLLQAEIIDLSGSLFKFKAIQIAAQQALKIKEHTMAQENLSFSAEHIEIDAILESQGNLTLEVKKNLQITFKGQILVKNHGQIIADTFDNAGNILSQSSFYCGINHLTCNRGNIAARTLQVDTAVYSNFWSIVADTIKINSLVSFTSGVVYAGKFENNTLFEIKAGIYLTKLPALQDMLTMTNLIEGGKLLTRHFVPHTFKALQFAAQTYQCVTVTLNEVRIQLENIRMLCNAKGIPSVPLHRVVPHLVRIKDRVLLIHNTTKEFNKEFKDIASIKAQGERVQNELRNWRIQLNQQTIKEVLADIKLEEVVAIVTPGYSSDALVSVDYGLSATAHSVSRSFYTHHAGMHTALGAISIHSNNLTLPGYLYGGGSITLKGKKYTHAGLVKSRSKVNVDFDFVELLTEHQNEMNHWHLKTKKFTVKGRQAWDNSEVKANDFHCVKGSELKLNRSLIVSDNEFKQDAKSKIHAVDSAIHGKDITLAGVVEGQKELRIKASGNFTTTEENHIKAEVLDIKSHVFEHSGMIEASQSLSTLSDRLYNWGTITVNGQAVMNVNQLMVNFNSISANDLTFNTAIFANFCDICGADRLSVNALVAYNAFVMRSMNVKITSLISLNTGVFLPWIPSSSDTLLTMDNALNVGKTVLYNVSSTAGSLLGTGIAAYRLVRNGKKGAENFKKLKNLGAQLLQDYQSVNVSELIAVVSDTVNISKDLADGASGLYENGKKSVEGIVKATDNSNNFSDRVKSVSHAAADAAYDFAYKTTLKDIAFAAYETTGPSISTSGIFTANLGAMASSNISNWSAVAVNSNKLPLMGGKQWAHNNYSSKTIITKNSGSILGHSVTMLSQYAASNKGSIKGHKLNLKAGRYTNQGIIEAHEADIEIKSLHQLKGKFETSKGSVKIDDLQLSGGKIDFQKTKANVTRTAEVNQTAEIKLTESTLQAGSLQSSGKIVAVNAGIQINDDTKINKGYLQLTNSSLSATGKVDLNEKVDINLKESVVIGSHLNLSAQITNSGKNIFVGREYLVFNNNASLCGSGEVIFESPQGKLEGCFSGDTAIVKIDKIDGGIKSLIYGTETAARFQPMSALIVETPEKFYFDKELTRTCMTELVAKGIDVTAPLNMPKGLNLVTTHNDLKINAKLLSQGNIGLKSAAHLFNYGQEIVADGRLYLETVQGDAHNIGGLMQGKKYCQANINGTFYNTAIAVQSPYQYGNRTQYISAKMLGGPGIEGVGLFINAEGKVINDASIIQSKGYNVLQAKKGYEEKFHTVKYLANHNKNNGWFSGNEQKITTTDVFGGQIISQDGRNIIIVAEGVVKANATRLISKDGTDIFARDKIDLKGVATQHNIREKKYSWFGLSTSKQCQHHQTITPSIIYDAGQSNIRSYQGDVHLQDTLILGPGKTTIKGKNVHISLSKENHVITNRSRSFQADAFGSRTLNALINGDNFVAPFVKEDPILRKVDALVHQTSKPVEFAANMWNTVVSGYNAYRTLSHNSSDGLGTRLMQRYGLRDNAGFNPAIVLSLNKNVDKHFYQTLSQGGFKKDFVDIEADQQIDINDCPIDITQHAAIRAQSLIQRGSVLKHNTFSKAANISLGMTLKGGLTSVGAGYQAQELYQNNYNTQELKAKILSINVTNWTMDQAQTNVQKINGLVDNLSVTSQQDQLHSKGFAVQANTSGFVQLSLNDRKLEKISNMSGLHVSGMQSPNQGLVIDQAELNGGEIRAPKNSVKVNTLIRNNIEDHETARNVGLSAPVLDLFPKNNSTSSSSVTLIPIVGFEYGNRNYQAVQLAQISDQKNGGDYDQKKIVLQDSSMNLKLDIPIFQKELSVKNEIVPIPSIDEPRALPKSLIQDKEVEQKNPEKDWSPQFFRNTKATVKKAYLYKKASVSKTQPKLKNNSSNNTNPQPESELFQEALSYTWNEGIYALREVPGKYITQMTQESLRSGDLLASVFCYKAKWIYQAATHTLAYTPYFVQYHQEENGNTSKAVANVFLDIGINSGLSFIPTAVPIYVCSNFAKTASKGLDKHLEKENDFLDKHIKESKKSGNYIAMGLLLETKHDLAEMETMARIAAIPAEIIESFKKSFIAWAFSQSESRNQMTKELPSHRRSNPI